MSTFKTYKPLSMALRSNDSEGFAGLMKAALKVCEGNDNYTVLAEEDTRWLFVSGNDESSLDMFCETLREKTGKHFTVGQPMVNYHCVLPETRKKKYRHRFVSSCGTGSIQFLILFEPQNLRGDITLTADMLEYPLNEEFKTAFQLGLNEINNAHGFALFDFKATLLSIEYEVRDNDPKHFFAAARRSLLDAYSKTEFVAVEPMLESVICVPEVYVEQIKADVISRRGHIESLTYDCGASTLTAFIPMSNMFGYTNSLRAMTNGGGTFTQKFSHFSKLPNPLGFEPDPEPISVALKIPG